MDIYDDPAVIAEEVRSTRKARGWRQLDLAEKALLDVKTIRNVEAGKRCTPGTYQQVFRALKVNGEREWPLDVRAITQALGHLLVELPEERRKGIMAKLIEVVVEQAAQRDGTPD